MKESITKFDLEAAFKALDEIEAPKVNCVKANKPALKEIFSSKSKFDALMEEYYDIASGDGLDKAKEARDAEIAQAKLARIEKIVDLDAESAEDILTSYVGKLIIQCPQCMTLFYKNPEDIEASEEDPTTVNVSEVCQHCGNESGYSLIGKVGDATDEKAAEDETASTTEDEAETETEDTAEDEEIDFELENDEESVEGEESEELDLDFDTELAELALETDEEDNTSDEDTSEEEKKEESFNIGEGEILTENLIEADNKSFDVSADEFEALINSPEFKKPISDRAVRAMLDMEESVSTETAENEISDEDLTEGKLADFGKALLKRAKQTGQNVKKEIEKAVDKFVENSNTREEKANWILEYSSIDYSKIETDEKGAAQPPAEDNKKYKTFIICCFKETFDDGAVIEKAPAYDDDTLVLGTDKPEEKANFADAEKIAKGWSQTQGNGPALIYLAKDSSDANATFLCEYFKGNLYYDQVNKYYSLVKKDIEGALLMKLGKLESSPEAKEAAAEETDADTESTTEALLGTELDNLFEKLEEIKEDILEDNIINSLTESYKNVNTFKLEKCSYDNNKFIIEGMIYFNSGNSRKTAYIFNEAIHTKNKITFLGLNEKLGLDKQFRIIGTIKDKTYFTESFNVTLK